MVAGMHTDARKLPPATQEEIRRRAVAAVRAGMRQTEAARVFGVARKSIWQWLKAFAEGGESALAARKRGPKGDCCRLKGWQAATVCTLIRDRCPEQLKMPFVLWTAAGVADLVWRRFKVRLAPRTVRRYLSRWGFTPQKPCRRAYERDPVAVARWLQDEYPAIRRRAKAQKARVYWCDEMGLRSDHQAGRSYAPRGQTPVVPGTGQRFGCSMLSAITNRGHLSFMVFRGRFTAPVFLRFLRRLVKTAGTKVFLIADGHPVHRSVQLRKWIETNRRHIELFYLPGYSPDLNPDEMLNQDVKANAVSRTRPRQPAELLGALRGYLRSRQRMPQLVARYFHETSVRYAAA
jgi:transposase